MDNKQTPDNKITAEEILKDSELDSVAGGGQSGPGDEFVPSDPTHDVLVFGQLGPG